MVERRVGGRPAGAPGGGSDDGLVAALEEVGDRWTLQVVDVLLDGPRRFNEVQAEVAGIATNVLSKRLLRLEELGLVVATAYSSRPPRYAYELTRAGHELVAAVATLRQWGARRHGAGGADDRVGPVPEHAACGSPMEQRWWCPACERTVEEDEVGQVRIV